MVSCVVEFSAAKLTKYLECKHEHALPSLLAVCQRAKASSDRFARNSASWKDWKGGGGCHGVSLHRHFSDTNTPQRNPTDDSLRDSFENSPFTDLTVFNFVQNVNPRQRRLRLVPKISAPHCFGPKSNLTNLPEAQRRRSYKNFWIKDRMPMVRWLRFRWESWTKNVLVFIHDGCWEPG